MRELLLATTNAGKVPEMQAGLSGVPFTLVTLRDVDYGGDIDEPAETLEGNAIIKAMTYGNRTGKLTLAEDTGLEVDALGGGPGVRTARYAPGTDEDRNEKLLRELDRVPDENRGAQFKAVMVVYDPVIGKIRTCEGVCRGHITRERKGTQGFGFSPIFYADELGKNFAEVDVDTRNSISHRGKALAKVREVLVAEFI